ncbi:hypothetical protein Jiend_56530 [Micromonospora endophytica]|nr:hypothetical protein Jiend_56530 [Micromonospora endophytica]
MRGGTNASSAHHPRRPRPASLPCPWLSGSGCSDGHHKQFGGGSAGSGITVPALLIGGGPPSPVPQQHVAELADRLADARLITIDAGHLVHETAPAAYLDAVTKFLAPKSE